MIQCDDPERASTWTFKRSHRAVPTRDCLSYIQSAGFYTVRVSPGHKKIQAKLRTKKQGKDGPRAGPSCWPETPHALIPSFSDERLKRFPSARAMAGDETVVRVPAPGAITKPVAT